MDKNKGSVVKFDDMLGARNSSQIHEVFTRGKHEALNVCHISRSYFILRRQSIRENSDRKLLSKQTLGDVESLYKDMWC